MACTAGECTRDIDRAIPLRLTCACAAAERSDPEAGMSVPIVRRPTRLSGVSWKALPESHVVDGEVVPYGVLVVETDASVSIHVEWPTVRAANEYGQSLVGVAMYDVVPIHRVNGP